jgi:hypothetical protein
MAKPVFYLKFSPDGKFFAAAGKFDRLAKVWWRTEGGVWPDAKFVNCTFYTFIS